MNPLTLSEILRSNLGKTLHFTLLLDGNTNTMPMVLKTKREGQSWEFFFFNLRSYFYLHEWCSIHGSMHVTLHTALHIYPSGVDIIRLWLAKTCGQMSIFLGTHAHKHGDEQIDLAY